jgi:Domain of unknown function DUF11
LASDVSVIAAVLAISLVILILSGLALYVAFRVRETFKDDKGTGIRTVKLVLLIGLLFLTGGVFYFFASGIGSPGASTTTALTSASSTAIVVASTPPSTITASTTVTVTTTPTTVTTTTTIPPTSTTSSISSKPPSTTSTGSSTSTTSSTSLTTTSTKVSGSGQGVSITLSYPSTVMVGSTFDFSITITNGGTGTANSVAIQAGDIFSAFKFVSSNYPTSGNVIVVGDVAPGSIVVNLELTAPSQPQQFSGTITLTYQQMAGPLAASVSIRVTRA